MQERKCKDKVACSASFTSAPSQLDSVKSCRHKLLPRSLLGQLQGQREMMRRMLCLLLVASAAAVSPLNYYQVPSHYWSGDRTHELMLTSDIRSLDSDTQMLQCVMQLSKRWQLGHNECVVFHTAAASPCFIGTLNAQYCENLQPLSKASDEGVVRVWVTSLDRQSACIIIQHRVSNSVSFYRNWTEYVNGFGDGPSGNFWIGLENIHTLTSANTRGLFIEMMMWNGTSYWACYSSFQVGPASDHYRLMSLGSFSPSSSQLGNCMTACLHQNFSTFDADFDVSTSSCSYSYKGGWWYSACHCTNPNGLYLIPPDALNSSSYARGIVWSNPFSYYYSMKEFKMLIW